MPNGNMINAAKASLDKWGFGLSSVRFICGTQSIHKDLEQKLSIFLEKELKDIEKSWQFWPFRKI